VLLSFLLAGKSFLSTGINPMFLLAA